MYLARTRVGGRVRYFIRESYLAEGVYVSRDLMDLGEDPRHFIRYPGRCAFYIDPVVSEALEDAGAEADLEAVEGVFWPFIDAEVKRKFGYTRTRGTEKGEPDVNPSAFHLFDRRRLHYLRFGQMDQSGLYRTSPKLFRGLSGKSRDELEQHFIAEEMRMPPHELKSYIYVSFDLQRHFYKSFAKEMPEALEESEVDTCFLSDICNLNGDRGFWAGMARTKHLHDYLKRYAIMFFDTGYNRSRYLDEILQNFINSRRDVRFPPKKREEALSEGSELFGVPESRLKKMSGEELTRLYRKKARDLHPDAGGSQEDFVKLTEVYQALKSGK